VWLSRWQLENINKNYLLPIELGHYLKLKNQISKALVPHLQIWLYASRNACAFEKRYDEICQVLNLHPYSHSSKIKEKLGPSRDELAEHGYLAGWNLDLTNDHTGHKIIFQHGERFVGDQRKTIASPSNPQVPQTLREDERKLNPSLVEELVRRNIPEHKAKKLLANIAEGQEVMDQLEWGDCRLKRLKNSLPEGRSPLFVAQPSPDTSPNLILNTCG